MWTTVPPAKSKVETLPQVASEESVLAPDHVRHGEVDDQRPQGREQQHAGELHALGEGSGDQRGRDDGEHQLVHHEGALRNGAGVIGVGIGADAVQEQILQAADEGVAFAEGEAVADDGPEHADHRHQHEAVHHGAENVFAADQAAVEERQAGAGHHQNQRGAGEHPGVIAGGLGGFGGLFEIGETFIEVRGRLGRSEGTQREEQQ